MFRNTGRINYINKNYRLKYNYSFQSYGNEQLILEVNIGDVITYTTEIAMYPEITNGKWIFSDYNDVSINGNTVTITGRNSYAYIVYC